MNGNFSSPSRQKAIRDASKIMAIARAFSPISLDALGLAGYEPLSLNNRAEETGVKKDYEARQRAMPKGVDYVRSRQDWR